MILSIGHVAFDLIANMQQLPGQNESRPVSRHKECFGGGGGNFAVAVRTLGEPASLFSVVGNDFRGSAYDRKLGALRIKRHLVAIDQPTARSWMFFAGNSYQSYFAGAFEAFMHQEVPRDLANAHIAHFTANSPEFVLQSMQRLRRLNSRIRLSLDPSYDVHLYTEETMRKCLGLADYFFCNEHELKDLRRQTGFAKVDILEHVKVLKVTEGPDGCTVFSRQWPDGLHEPALNVEVANTVGAGDAHAAGFLVAQRKGLDLRKSAQVANFVASRVIQRMGPQEGLLRWEQIPAKYRN